MAGNTGTSSSSKSSNSGGGSNDSDVKQDFDALRSDFADLKKDLKHLLESAVGEGKGKAHEAKDRIEHKIEDTTDTLQANIRDNPFTSIAIAAAAGVVLGLFFRRG